MPARKTEFSEFVEFLQKEIEGKVFTDTFTRYLYSTDASSYQIMPEAVVIPKTEADVQRVVTLAHQYQIPIIPRGGGSSLSGQGIGEGIVLDFTVHLNQIEEILLDEKIATVQSGVVLNQLNAALSSAGLMVGPDPSSAAVATIGGMTANNSTGSHSIVYGMMVDNVLAVKVVLANGEIVTFKETEINGFLKNKPHATLEHTIYTGVFQLVQQYNEAIKNGYPKTWRNVAGYNLNRIHSQLNKNGRINLTPLLVGSEGTLAAILSVTLKLVPQPKATGLALFHFKSIREALQRVPEILTFKPSALELLDAYFIHLTRKNTEYRQRLTFLEGDPAAVLIVEYFGEETGEVAVKIDHLIGGMRRKGFNGAVVKQLLPQEVANVWEVRKAGLGLLLSKRGDAKPLAFIDDVAVPVEQLAEYAEGVMQICKKYNTEAAFYAHASAGCLHINPVINLKTRQGIEQLKHISQEAIALGISLGGTSTGEHGEGLARSYYNEQVYGPELHRAFRKLKHLFDPHNIMNPGKIVDKPLPWDETILRLNPAYSTPLTIRETVQDFSQDGGFAGLVEMCNGQGYCRNVVTGTMCPSFRVTRDEALSTRGRANGLRAAMTGSLGAEGMTHPQLKQSLDLCLACKACKVECPSLVDMTKLKTEFLYHYYHQEGTPLSATILGHIDSWYRFARLLPAIANKVMGSGWFRSVLAKYFEIDPRRSLPPIAKQSFYHWWRNHKVPSQAGQRGKVILWDDSFTVTHEPQIAQAAVQVLETLGYQVFILKEKRCCGRPKYSQGLLPDAAKAARKNIEIALPYVQRNIPIIFVEPSCLSMFRDEYLTLVPGKAARQVAKLALGIEEFIVQQVETGLEIPWPKTVTPREVGVHVHCHQQALGLKDMQLKMLALIPGAKVKSLSDATCCGMAGAFGYKKGQFELSMKIGEEKLFPAIRQQSSATAIVAAGTSCRHQIADGTHRIAKHPIVIFAEALLGEKFQPLEVSTQGVQVWH